MRIKIHFQPGQLKIYYTYILRIYDMCGASVQNYLMMHSCKQRHLKTDIHLPKGIAVLSCAFGKMYPENYDLTITNKKNVLNVYGFYTIMISLCLLVINFLSDFS